MASNDICKVLIYGNTLAASMTVLALSKALPKHMKLHWLKPHDTCPSDALYGGITSPDAYQFNLENGITEPELILKTDTTFSLGTHFKQWGDHKKTWVQCFHLPFAAISGVELHHFMTKHNANLGDYLISAQAAIKGTFAHPPNDNPQSPLSRAEYGYHFDAGQWATLINHKIEQQRLVNIISGDIKHIVHSSPSKIDYVHLFDDKKIQADWFIDCGAIHSPLLSSLGDDFEHQRQVHIRSSTQTTQTTGGACRVVNSLENGWEAITPLRRKNQRLTLLEGHCENENTQHTRVNLGNCKTAWRGNCVGLGHAVYALEPVTPAPYMLLLKDIARLLELIPVSQDTEVEKRHYNRRYYNDVNHAVLFHKALYANQRDVGYKACEKLDRKLKQYLHRGMLASYDFEPFNEQDWAILHAGLGRKSQHYSPMADQVDFEKMQASLHKQRAGIAHLAASMPLHHLYLEKLSAYLKESSQHG